MSAVTANKRLRINHFITNTPQVRLFIDDTPLGVVSIEEARRKSFDLGLDLVETVPHAKPPVCKIIDYGKFKYDEKIKKKEDQKKHKSIAGKEIQLRYCISDHDLDTKVSALKKFLTEKRHVKVVMRFKNREIAFKPQGEQVLKRVATLIEEVGTLTLPRLDGKSLIAQASPK